MLRFMVRDSCLMSERAHKDKRKRGKMLDVVKEDYANSELFFCSVCGDGLWVSYGCYVEYDFLAYWLFDWNSRSLAVLNQ